MMAVAHLTSAVPLGMLEMPPVKNKFEISFVMAFAVSYCRFAFSGINLLIVVTVPLLSLLGQYTLTYIL